MDDAEQQLTQRLAGFLIQALSLDEEPSILAAEITPLKRDVNAGISTVELTSSVGDVAFLLYHYRLDLPNEAGETGRDLFDIGLATLEEAAERGAPGPRLMAHATTDIEAYILATTPAAHRALTGQAPLDDTSPIEATTTDLLLAADHDQARRDAATKLLHLLQEANTEATTWLAATRAASNADTSQSITFNEEETALALYLMDERSIQNLLQTLNQLLSTARQRSAEAVDPSNTPDL